MLGKGTSLTMIATISLVVSVLLIVGIQAGYATSTSTPVNLGTAAPFAVLANTQITNTGTTILTGDLGLYAGSSYPSTGITYIGSSITHIDDSVAIAAQTDLTYAITQAMSYAASPIPTALDGQTLVAGVYSSTSTAFTLSVGGVLTLNGNGDPSSVWIFQAPDAIAGALSTTGGSVVLENGADSCNVFWVTSAGDATIGTYTTFVGTIMAYSSVTLGTGTTLQGAALASTGEVTMDTNTISTACVTSTTSSPTSPTSAFPTLKTAFPSAFTSMTAGGSVTDTASLLGGNSPTGTIQFWVSTTSTCLQTPATKVGSAVTVSGNGFYSSGPQTFSTTGKYYMYAVYSGDFLNNGAVSGCEPFTVTGVTGVPGVPEFPVGMLALIGLMFPALLLVRKYKGVRSPTI